MGSTVQTEEGNCFLTALRVVAEFLQELNSLNEHGNEGRTRQSAQSDSHGFTSHLVSR